MSRRRAAHGDLHHADPCQEGVHRQEELLAHDEAEAEAWTLRTYSRSNVR